MPCVSCGTAYRRVLVVEKEDTAVVRETIEGDDAVVGRMEMLLAGRRHSRFAVVPANLWRAGIVFVVELVSDGVERSSSWGEVGRDGSLLQWLVSACSPASIGHKRWD